MFTLLNMHLLTCLKLDFYHDFSLIFTFYFIDRLLTIHLTPKLIFKNNVSLTVAINVNKINVWKPVGNVLLCNSLLEGFQTSPEILSCFQFVDWKAHICCLNLSLFKSSQKLLFVLSFIQLLNLWLSLWHQSSPVCVSVTLCVC